MRGDGPRLAAVKKLALAVVLASCVFASGLSQARGATCSSSGGFTTCKYWDGYMPAYANGLPYYAASGNNYWYTNRMWRPVNHWATVAFGTATCQVYNWNA